MAMRSCSASYRRLRNKLMAFTDRLEFIGSLATESADSPWKFFSVRLSLDRTDPRLRPGMSAQVSFLLGSVPDAIVVPLDALPLDPHGKVDRRALPEPARWIAENAGENGSVVVEMVREKGKTTGFNALTRQYEDMFAAGIVDPAKVDRSDIRLLAIPANDIARETVGSQQLASMVALGAYVSRTAVVGMETLFACLPKVISKRYEKFIPLNVNALKEGESFARNHA